MTANCAVTLCHTAAHATTAAFAASVLMVNCHNFYFCLLSWSWWVVIARCTANSEACWCCCHHCWLIVAFYFPLLPSLKPDGDAASLLLSVPGSHRYALSPTCLPLFCSFCWCEVDCDFKMFLFAVMVMSLCYIDAKPSPLRLVDDVAIAAGWLLLNSISLVVWSPHTDAAHCWLLFLVPINVRLAACWSCCHCRWLLVASRSPPWWPGLLKPRR